jgi:hypothetical protein
VEEGVPVDFGGGVLEFAEGVAELGVGEEFDEGAFFGVPVCGGEDGGVGGSGHGGAFREGREEGDEPRKQTPTLLFRALNPSAPF